MFSLRSKIDSLTSNQKLFMQIFCTVTIVGYMLYPATMLYLVSYALLYAPVFFCTYALFWSLTTCSQQA